MATTLENALRLVKPGEMVVSLTDMLDKLGSKLTDDEKQQLMIAMLSPRREKVQPGDLITSDLMNQVLVDIADLQLRVEILSKGETPTGHRIVIRFPTENDVLHVGEPLILIGENIPQDVSVQLDTRSVGGIVVSSDGTRLTIARIPDFSPPPEGRQITITLVGTSDSATGKFLLKPSETVKPIGSLTVVYSAGPTSGTKFQKGGEYEFTFKVTADTRPDESFLVNASIGNDTWRLKKPAEIFIPAAVDARTPTVVELKITVVIFENAIEGDSGNLALSLQSKRNPSIVGVLSPEILITINESAQQPQALGLDLSSTAGEAGIINNTDGTKTASIGMVGGGGGTGQLNFQVTKTGAGTVVAGNYQVNLTNLAVFEGDSVANPKWSARVPGSVNGIVTLGSGTPEFAIEVTANAGAAPAKLQLELSKVGDSSTSSSGKFNVIREV